LTDRDEDSLLSKSAISTYTAIRDTIGPTIEWTGLKLQEWADLNASSQLHCSDCQDEFGYMGYNKYACKLCCSVYCGNCLRFQLTLKCSPLTPLAPVGSASTIWICKYCSQIIIEREKALHIQKQIIKGRENKGGIIVLGMMDIKYRISNRIAHFYSQFHSLHHSLPSHSSTTTGEESELDSCDEDSDVEIKWTSIDLASSGQEFVDTLPNFEKKVVTEETQTKISNEQKQLMLYIQEMKVLLEGELKRLMSVPCRSRKEKLILGNVKHAMLEFIISLPKDS